MSLTLYQSNRLEALLSQFAHGVLADPLSSPFVTERVVVQTQGMAQWLKLRLAATQGVVANAEFPFPRAFISWLMRRVLPPETLEGAIEPEALTWRVMDELPRAAQAKGCADIANYLGPAPDPRRVFQLAERIAHLFDQYSVFRPEWIDQWQQGRGNDWQAQLWRATMTGNLACQGKYLYELIQALRRGDLPPDALPERVTIFAPATLPPVYLNVFQALAERIPVHLFCLCPSREYWGDAPSAREMGRLRARVGAGTDPADLHLDAHPLLGSLGKTGRGFQNLVADLEPVQDDRDLFVDPGRGTLLASVQSSLLTYESGPPPAPGERAVVQAGDRSIQVHSCHSPLRELQVLRDHLLDWFAADPALQPHDIVVVLPEIEKYAPFVQGVFDSAEPGAPAIPYTLAQRGVRQESPLIDGFVQLLRLPGGRLTVSSVLDFLEIPAVRTRFGVAEEDLPQIRQWIKSAGIRWGRDAGHRESLGLPAFPEHTWVHGRDRLLLGYAMSDDANALVNGLLPCGGVEGTTGELLGAWLDFQQTLFDALEDLAQPRSLEEWAATLTRLLDRFFLPELREAPAEIFIRQAAAALRQQQAASGFLQPVPLAVVLERLLPQFEQGHPGKAFLRGAVTFSGLSPARGLPFRVLCALGMHDGAFPATPSPASFDRMAREPRDGDASQRDEDRYLFLEMLLSARERLYLSYVGQSVRDNSPRPPSVVVSELLDYLSARFRLADEKPGENRLVPGLLVTKHRLHPFSPAYFRGGQDQRLFSYSPAAAALSAVLANREAAATLEPFLKDPLPVPPGEWTRLPLRQLQSFFRNPARFFVEQRLDFRLAEDEELPPEEEPFSVGGLEAYHCKQELVESLFDGGSAAKIKAVWQASGVLPPGPAGAVAANDLEASVEPLRGRLRELTGGRAKSARDFTVIVGGYEISGRLPLIEGLGLVHCRAAKTDPKKKGAAHLALWIEHLLLHVAGIDAPRKSWLVGEDGTWCFSEVEDARAQLEALLSIFGAGLARPLPFFPESAFVFVIPPGKASRTPPLAAALRVWEGNEEDDDGAESADPYFSLCFRHHPDPLGEEFQALAKQVVEPLLKHHGAVK